jgi:hypothetical protein
LTINPLDSPALFPVLFLFAWLTIGALLSFLSGWTALAQQFRAESGPVGKELRGQVVSVGIVGDKNVTYVSVSDRGLYLRSHVLFRFMRAPVLVPWSEVKYVSERKVLWWRSYLVDLAGITTIRVKEGAFRAIEGFLLGGSATAARRMEART